MRHRVFASALLALALTACGGDSKITEPQGDASKVRVLAAVGTDPVTGAAIETNLDDYLPGGTVSLVGRGWAPNETVHLVMTEDPDVHADVSKDVQADATGAFSVEFYVVQQSDLGVTFTLTATGRISGSIAVATFTDGSFQIGILTNPSGILSSSIPYIVRNDCSTGGGAATGSYTVGGVTRIGVNGNKVLIFKIPSPAGSTFLSFSAPGLSVTTVADSLCVAGGSPTGPDQNKDITLNYNAPSNTAPNVSAGGPYSGNEGSQISIIGTATDTDGSIASTAWSVTSAPAGVTCTFGDASLLTTTVTCNDNNAATITLTLTAVDDDGASSSSNATLNVANVPPTATFNTPASVAAATTFTISLTAPVEPSTVDAGSLQYAFDCGAGYGAFSSSTSAICPGAPAGSVTVKGKVQDKDGGLNEYTAKVAVDNVPPTADAGGTNGVYSGNEGSAIAINGSGADPDGGAVTFAWSIAPNDGHCAFASPSSASTTVTCNDNGTWTLTLTVTDNEGASTNANATLNVANVPPTATFNAPSTINEGSSISLSLTNPVEPSTVDAANLQYAFDCGSGYGAPSPTSTASCPTTDNGSRTVKGKIQDKDGGFSEYTATVTIDNVAPTATFGAPSPVSEGSAIGLALTGAVDPSSDDVAAGLKYAFDCGDGAGYGALSATSTASCPTNDNGSRSVKGKIQDKDGGFTEYSATVTINNVAPTATFTAPSPVDEGSAIALALTGPFDPSSVDVAAGFQYAFDCGDGAGYAAYSSTTTRSCPTSDNGTRTVRGKIKDKDGGETAYTKYVTVNNVAPVITLPLNIPVNPIPAGTALTLTWNFTDPGADSWECKISWDLPSMPGPIVFDAPFNSSGKSCSATKTLSAGIYTVTVHVADDDGGYDQETATAYIVVYDPNAGFVTGGGWINSLPGAYALDPELTGKANFGFVSKYKKGATAPDGNTEFQFHAGNLNFKSVAYEWLVVAGAKAQFKGTGTINGSGNYGFILTAIDGQVPGGGGVDKFRMKIWIMNPNGTESVIYDNQMDGAVDADPTTALGGGSINIQAK